MQTHKIFISLGLSLLLLGCNSNDTKSDGAGTQKISVPKNIDMKLPKALESGSKTQKKLEKKDELSANTSRGYLQLKDDIEGAEGERKEVQINLLLADKLMPQIQTACEDTPVSQTCEIESDELSFVLDSTMREDIANIIGETFPKDIEDKEFTLGKTTFTQYPDSEDYQYTLSMDMSKMIRRDESDKTRYTQIIKWSKDENRVWSIYAQENGDASSTLSLRYTKDANGQTQMDIDEKSNSVITTSSSTHTVSTSTPVESNSSVISLADDTPLIKDIEDEFHFKITNKEDYFKIISNGRYFEDEKKIESSSSVGEISDKGGYLNFRGVFLDNEYREKEKFNAEGKVVFSGYCDSSQACEFNDESTWFERGDENFEPAIDTDIAELTVSGGTLKEGAYLLLAPNTDIDKLSVEEVFDATVGDIYMDKEGTYGVLYNKEYLSTLDTLMIVRVIFDTDAGVKDLSIKATFELVTNENRPTLEVK